MVIRVILTDEIPENSVLLLDLREVTIIEHENQKLFNFLIAQEVAFQGRDLPFPDDETDFDDVVS